MHGEGCNEEVLALAMYTVRYPRRSQIRCFVPVGKKLFVDEPITENTAMRIHLAREFGKFLPRNCKTLVCISDFRCQRIQRGYCLRKDPLCGLQCDSSL